MHVQAHTCERAVPHVCTHSHTHIHVLTALHAYSRMCIHAAIHTQLHEQRRVDRWSISTSFSVNYRNCLFILLAMGLVTTPTDTGIRPGAEPSTGPRWPVMSSIWHSPASTFQQHSLNVKMHVWGPVLNFINWLTMDKPLTRFKIIVSPAKASVRVWPVILIICLVQGDKTDQGLRPQ